MRRINSPYVYLVEQHGPAGISYVLYVYIAIYDGTTLTQEPLSAPTVPIISFKIAGTARSTNIVDKYLRFNLQAPPTSANPLDAPDLTVEVKKVRSPSSDPYGSPAGDPDPDQYGNRETTILYGDADELNPILGDIAFNCPYMYMTNPYAIEGMDRATTPDPLYAGHCHVPMLNFDYSPTAQTSMDTSSRSNGEQKINVFPSVSSTRVEVNVADVDCNQKEYVDANRQLGWFYVTINHSNLPDTALRKGKLRNRSSDTHPNGFID